MLTEVTVNYFTICVRVVIMMYTLNLHSDVCQLYLSKTGIKKKQQQQQEFNDNNNHNNIFRSHYQGCTFEVLPCCKMKFWDS